MTRTALVVATFTLLSACGEPAADANGRFEATEVTVSAEVSGRLLTLTAAEGDAVTAGATLGVLDTTALQLSREELAARAAVLRARRAEAEALANALQSQVELAAREAGRVQRLQTEGAATAQRLDRALREHEVLVQQQAARVAALQALDAEAGAIQAQQAQVDDRLARARVQAPLAGVVLTRFVEPGELVQAGMPLLRLAALDTLTLRAYLAESQLRAVRVGEAVRVQVDGPDGTLESREGRVAWVAPSAEFTPTPIQTREERIAQVYAVTVRVPNLDGRLRIGMPGELVLTPTTASTP